MTGGNTRVKGVAMDDKGKKRSSVFKKFFSWGKKEDIPDDKLETREQGGTSDSDPDFGLSEITKKALGSFSIPKDKQEPIKEEAVERKVPAPSDPSLGIQNPHSDFVNDEGDVVSRVHASPRFEPAKKSPWSADEQPVRDEAVVTIDEINNFSGLIIPKSATFEVDELRMPAWTQPFDLKSTGRIPTNKDDTLSGEEFRTVIEAAAGIEAESPKKSILAKLNPLNVIHPEVVEYDRKIHGPLVDLTFRPRPGIEEIELYPVNEPYGYIRITYDHSTHENTYEILEPVLTKAEEELFSEIKERIFERLDVNSQNMPDDQARTTLRNVTNDVIADFGIHLTPVQREKILYSMYKEFLGNGMIDPIMHDRYIEDISCDGVNLYLFVYHIRYESMRTNLRYKTTEELDSFVTKLAQRSGKYISIAEPMLDSTMHDGSRIQMTLGTEVTAHGSTYTIRKFKYEPITPTDLIEWSTFSPLSIAFLWLAVESGKSCIFAGGTASGKTTSLNAISLFIPPLAKIVTLEDTRELKLPHPNWIPSVTRTSFDTEERERSICMSCSGQPSVKGLSIFSLVR
jgi:archaeal flagellar protein FlaI